MQSKGGLATCPPVPQSQATTGKERTGSATHVLLWLLCPADCTVSARPVPNLLTILTSARKVAVTRSLPCSSWKHPHTPLSACDCAWPPSALKSPDSAPPMSCSRVATAWSPGPPAGGLARRGAPGTDQDAVLRCRLLCDHALQHQQVGAGRSGAISATANPEQCSVDEVVADGMRQRPDVAKSLQQSTRQLSRAKTQGAAWQSTAPPRVPT